MTSKLKIQAKLMKTCWLGIITNLEGNIGYFGLDMYNVLRPTMKQ